MSTYVAWRGWRAIWVVAVMSGVAAAPAQEAKSRVVLLVDSSVYPELKQGLAKYTAHVQKVFPVEFKVLADKFYEMKPPAIRAILKQEYQTSKPPLVGALMVGPIPYALRGDPKEIVFPAPLFYEDFDAQWEDKNGDGVYQEDEVVNDRKANPTEIWTAWWIPPANDGPTQIKLLKGWLDKLDRYYRDELTGRDQMLWLAGNVTDVEICEGWTVLLKDTMKPLDQKLYIWCRVGQDEGTFRPNKRKDEFGPKDFVTAFTLQRWQHCHVVVHGNPRGWYWENTGVVAARRSDGEPEWSLLMDPSAFQGAAANIVTTSGCSNGNFRGDYLKPDYDRAIGNLLLFSPDTVTIAYYGAASPQSTSSFAGYCTEIVEALKADGGSYLAEGYKKMRNQDYSWGTQHFFFRGGDEKILSGDPFARYRPSPAPTPAQVKAVEEKIKAANWTVVGPG
jgi:hypothetical protein